MDEQTIKKMEDFLCEVLFDMIIDQANQTQTTEQGGKVFLQFQGGIYSGSMLKRIIGNSEGTGGVIVYCAGTLLFNSEVSELMITEKQVCVIFCVMGLIYCFLDAHTIIDLFFMKKKNQK